MAYIVDFKNVSTIGLESSPVAEALSGLRANEARYFMNKYKHEFMVVPATEGQEIIDNSSISHGCVNDILSGSPP